MLAESLCIENVADVFAHIAFYIFDSLHILSVDDEVLKLWKYRIIKFVKKCGGTGGPSSVCEFNH